MCALSGPSDLSQANSYFFSGGGIGGLCSAIAIGQQLPTANIDVYESVRAFSEAGAGITLFPRVLASIKELGLENEFMEIRSEIPASLDPGEGL